jgi:copper chaperone CopZ
MPERVDAFRAVMAEVGEAKLLEVNFDTAQAKLAYDAESQLLRGATPEQVVERLNNRVRQASRSLFGLQSSPSLPREKLELVEIPIVGLDCQACSLAAYEILTRVDGVQQATANFRTGRATAWIDPARTDRAKLMQALEQRQVKVGER